MRELYTVEDGWIETFIGNRFPFSEVRPHHIHITDVGHALSLLCRYNGHVGRFYSVAEHSLHIAEWAFRSGKGFQGALTALLHDAAEAYIGDLPRPIKAKVPQFKEWEAAIDEAVARKFGTTYPFPDWLKDADSRILCDERQQAMSDSGLEWGTDALEPLGVTLKFMPPEQAERMFAHAFNQLYSEAHKRA